MHRVDQKIPTKAEEQARDGRHLDIDLAGHGGNAATSASLAAATLRGRLSTTDALKFDALVAAKAAELAHHGDTTSLDIRRAKALELIADQLLTGELDLDLAPADDDATSTSTSAGAGASGARAGQDQPGTTTNGAAALRKSCLPATSHLHVRVEDLLAHLAGHTTLGTVEKLGPATLDLLAEWLGQTDLHIAPVLDTGRTDGVDSHDPPDWMRELVIDRDRHCAFPHCNRDARSCDLDHLVPYDPDGPPGQTRPDNLAPHCADGITAPRPSPDGATTAWTPATTNGPTPTDSPTSHPSDLPRSSTTPPTPHDYGAQMLRRQRVHRHARSSSRRLARHGCMMDA